jgi:hypothetical protein
MKRVRVPLQDGRLAAGSLAIGLLLVLATGTVAADLSLVAPAPPVSSWSLGLRSTGHMFQTVDAAGAKEDQFQSYNVVTGTATGLAGGRLAFRGSGRFANEQPWMKPGFETSRLYTGHLEARLHPRVKARLGRQLVQSGVASLTLDGAWLSYRRSPAMELTAWGGTRSPYGHGFDLAKLDESAAAGGRVALRPHRLWRVSASGAYRERGGLVAERPLGLEARTTAVRNTQIFARAAYDLEGDRWARLQAQARWRHRAQRTEATFQFIDRHPSIDAASWFARFTDVKRIRIARGTVRYAAPSRFGGEFEYLGSFVDTRNSTRVGLAVLVPGGRVGYSVGLGDAGEENRFYGEFGGRVRPWLHLDAHATVLTYALMQDAPTDQERDLTTLAARARIDLRPGMRVTAEVQSLENPLNSKDVRFLLGVDLAMARGSSRLGLDHGGWLQ